MPLDANNNSSSNISDYGNREDSTGLFESGENADGEEDEETDGTAENVSENDPEKNKKLAEITMSEQIRDTYQLTVRIPKAFMGIHTNQFFFMELSDQFYEHNYPDIVKVIADKKYARFAGFEKGRFFIDKIVEKGGIDGWSTELTLNPIPPSLAVYSKLQQEATKALITAVTDEAAISGGGVNTGTGNANFAGLDEIYSIAATFNYGGQGTGLSPEKAWELYEGGCRTFDCYDCSNWLFYCLRAKGIPCQIIQGSSPYSGSGTHRVVRINNNGVWECPEQAWSLTTNLRPFRPPEKYGAEVKLQYDGGSY